MIVDYKGLNRIKEALKYNISYRTEYNNVEERKELNKDQLDRLESKTIMSCLKGVLVMYSFL